MARLGLSAPWTIFYRELEMMFEKDPGVRVVFDEKNKEVRLYVEKEEKASALMELLPSKKEFGSYTLMVTVIPANGVKMTQPATYAAALDGNPALSYIKTIRGIFSNDLTYVVFKNKVVQYFNDDLGDVNGNCSTLYQEIAKDIFVEQQGIFFCTDVPSTAGTGSLGEPLGEWP